MKTKVKKHYEFFIFLRPKKEGEPRILLSRGRTVDKAHEALPFNPGYDSCDIERIAVYGSYSI